MLLFPLCLILTGTFCACGSAKEPSESKKSASSEDSLSYESTVSENSSVDVSTSEESSTASPTIIIQQQKPTTSTSSDQSSNQPYVPSFVGGSTPIDTTNIDSFAYCNANICNQPFRGIVIDFHGLGETGMKFTPPALGQLCAEKGIIYIMPYDNPWSWMNDLAVRYVDEIVDAVIKKYSLSDNIPIVSCGGSMGGLSALIYTRYAKRTPVACAVNCAVCDLPYHYDERADLPHTIYSAFMHYPCDLQAAIESASPLHQVSNMPKIPYYVVAGGADTAVNKVNHSDKFVTAMKEKQYDVTYIEVPNMGHCELSEDNLNDYFGFITSSKWFG